MKIVFLDIDGVLNSRKTFAENQKMFREPVDRPSLQLINRVNEILDRTGAKIVISSSWRFSYKIKELRELLEDCGLNKNSIIDYTPILHFSRSRGKEIEKYLQESKIEVETFVIIDDDSDMDNLKNKLVKTSFENGIQNEHVKLAIKKLGEVNESQM